MNRKYKKNEKDEGEDVDTEIAEGKVSDEDKLKHKEKDENKDKG